MTLTKNYKPVTFPTFSKNCLSSKLSSVPLFTVGLGIFDGKKIFCQFPIYLEIFIKFDCIFFVFTYVMYATRGRFLPLHPFLLFLLSNFWQVFVKVTEIQSLFSKHQIYVHFFCPNMLWILLTFTCQIILTYQDTRPPYFILTLPYFQKPPSLAHQISIKYVFGISVCTSEKSGIATNGSDKENAITVISIT